MFLFCKDTAFALEFSKEGGTKHLVKLIEDFQALKGLATKDYKEVITKALTALSALTVTSTWDPVSQSFVQSVI